MQEDSGNGTASGGVVGGPAGGGADNEDTPAASPPSPESPPLPPSPPSPTNGTTGSDGGSTPAASPESPPSPESPTNGTTGSDGGITQAASPPSSTSPTNGATGGAEGPTPSAPAFYKEGDTIKCPNAKVGDTGVIGDKTYTKRGVTDLKGLVQTRKEGDLVTSCTSGVKSMSELFQVRAPPSCVLLLRRRVVVLARPPSPRSEIAAHSPRPPVPRCAIECQCLQPAHRWLGRELGDEHGWHVPGTYSFIPRVASLPSLCRRPRPSPIPCPLAPTSRLTPHGHPSLAEM